MTTAHQHTPWYPDAKDNEGFFYPMSKTDRSESITAWFGLDPDSCDRWLVKYVGDGEYELTPCNATEELADGIYSSEGLEEILAHLDKGGEWR